MIVRHILLLMKVRRILWNERIDGHYEAYKNLNSLESLNKHSMVLYREVFLKICVQSRPSLSLLIILMVLLSGVSLLEKVKKKCKKRLCEPYHFYLKVKLDICLV